MLEFTFFIRVGFGQTACSDESTQTLHLCFCHRWLARSSYRVLPPTGIRPFVALIRQQVSLMGSCVLHFSSNMIPIHLTVYSNDVFLQKSKQWVCPPSFTSLHRTCTASVYLSPTISVSTGVSQCEVDSFTSLEIYACPPSCCWKTLELEIPIFKLDWYQVQTVRHAPQHIPHPQRQKCQRGDLAELLSILP